MANERRLADGRVELVDTRRVEASALYNRDLAPVPLARRNWTTYNYAALWVSMAHCIPTYMLASGLLAAGMNWSQALATILLGNTIVLIPILLNSHPGTKYGIPFPVFARAAYGTLGSNVPALMRALVACGWFGIQAWIGGEALHTFFRTIVPGWPTLLGPGFGGHTTTEWLSFLLFWGINVYIIYRGMDLLREVENWAAPFVLVMTTVLLVWAVRQAHGLGPLLQQPGRLPTLREFLGIVMQPWRLLADPSGYIFTWLLGYSGGLGSIAGVLIADYWVVRGTRLRLEDLYLPGGAYRYNGGWNMRAVAATLLGCA